MSQSIPKLVCSSLRNVSHLMYHFTYAQPPDLSIEVDAASFTGDANSRACLHLLSLLLPLELSNLFILFRQVVYREPIIISKMPLQNKCLTIDKNLHLAPSGPLDRKIQS
jgi:hypothetical protein